MTVCKTRAETQILSTIFFINQVQLSSVDFF
uniref:Uncharacterized protein n=1 Tax=Anguilla anguilla TaxID=7936 RepID=A0A0E9VL49_ANGAN